jgi:hypothetical protein
LVGGGQGRKHRGGLLDRARRKRRLLLDGGDEFGGDLRPLFFGRLFVDALCEAGNLVVRPQPAHQPAPFFLGTFLVQRNEPRQNFVIREVGWPAIGLRYGDIELIVQLLHD